MFRRSGIVIVIVAIIIVSTAVVTVLMQPSLLLSSTDDEPTPPTSLPLDSSSGRTVPDDSIFQADTVDATPLPDASVAQSSSAPHASQPSQLEPTQAPTEPKPELPFSLPEPPESALDQRQIEAPLQLKIPALGIDTTIEWVGLDADGNMAVPSTYRSVAWYENGAKPGMTGNAVIAGHYDSRTGPAIFYRLGDLKPGDEIIIVTHGDEEVRFAVSGVKAFDASSPPSYEIFGPTPASNLNLITCEGSFDPTARQYDQRLVVYSTLVSS